MRDHPDEFKPFLPVNGGQRRNPKRKNAGTASTSFTFTAATETEIAVAYEAHLAKMAQGGVWGDNVEIQAFANAYNTDVKIYIYDQAYYVRAASSDNSVPRVLPIAHIAHHVRLPLS